MKKNLIDSFKEKKEFIELQKKLKINSSEIEYFLLKEKEKMSGHTNNKKDSL